MPVSCGRTAMPRATFVRLVDIVPDTIATLPQPDGAPPPLPEQARLDLLQQRDRDVQHRIVLERPDAVQPAPAADVQSEITITSYQDERVVLQVTCSHDGYVRLADPFDQGWRATIDNQPTEILIADHYLRAVYVEPGEHEIVFTYDGARVVWPLRFTLLAWLAVLFCLLPVRKRQSLA